MCHDNTNYGEITDKTSKKLAKRRNGVLELQSETSAGEKMNKRGARCARHLMDGRRTKFFLIIRTSVLISPPAENSSDLDMLFGMFR